MRRRHDHRAMPIGMHEIAIVHGHAEHGDFAAEFHWLGVRVRCRDAAGEKLECRRPLIDVANRTIGDHAERPQSDVNRRLHFAPEGTAAGFGAIEILDDDDRRFPTGIDMTVIVVLQLPLRRRRESRRTRGPNRGGARISDDGRLIRKAANERRAGVATCLR